MYDYARQSYQFITTTKKVANDVERMCKYGRDIRIAVEKLELPERKLPDDPPKDSSPARMRMWKKELHEASRRKICLAENVNTLYWLVWDQCTFNMQMQLKTLSTYDKLCSELDGIGLLKAIKHLMYKFPEHRYLPHSLHDAMRRFYTLKQGPNTPMHVHLEKFLHMVEVIEYNGGTFGEGVFGVEAAMEQMIATEKGKDVLQLTAAEKAEALDRFLAVDLILGSDRTRYGALVTILQNDFLLGKNSYPKTLAAARNLLNRWT